MIIRMAVADRNKEYVERLINGLEQYTDLQLSVYTDRKSMQLALQTKRFDIVLFDSSVYKGTPPLAEHILGIVLCDDESEIPSDCKHAPRIKKYQRISKIYQKILELYADVCGRNTYAEDGNRARITAFYSPAGGCGKTTLTLASACCLAQRGHKVFYINLEDIASEDFYLPQSEEKGMSDLLVCLGTEINFKVKLQGLLRTKTDNFYYLNHFATPNDVYELKEDELEELLRAVSDTGLFDHVVIDMGISLDRKTIRIFECVDQIVMIGKSDAMAVRKLKTFAQQTHIMNACGGKIVSVMNCEKKVGGVAYHGISADISIPWVRYADEAELIEALAGRSVDGLVELLEG